MFVLSQKTEYDGNMDPEVVSLCDALNSLPGIKTTESCCGHGQAPVQIFFDIEPDLTNQGLFFLGRCINNRYWEYGHLWEIVIEINDVRAIPLGLLRSVSPSNEVVGDLAYKQAHDLVRNMNHHVNHKNFIEIFKIDLSRFSLETT